ncbi:MAG: HAD family acid phosphatase [Verrucomicrobiota bacterium]
MIQARPFLLSLLLAAGLGSCAAPASREPGNLSVAKNEVKAYVDSGAYEDDLAEAAKPAKDWIVRRATTGVTKPAVVFDIDETTLSNLDHMTKTDWGYQPEFWSKWVMESKARAIVPAREVFLTARAHHVTVFFITGRRESEKAATARNLRTQGMGDFAGLLVRSDTSKTPVKDFKTSERKRITDQGYTIIANLGDQQSDLDGGYAERTFKLPNPFYFIP